MIKNLSKVQYLESNCIAILKLFSGEQRTSADLSEPA